MDVLNFPSSYEFRIREADRKKLIFDVVRKKFVALTPEEWVRQHLIHYFHIDKHWPLSLLAVETSIRFQGMMRRCDLIAYAGTEPRVLVECKAPSVKIDQEVLAQLARYQSVVRVPWMLVSNGKLHISLRLTPEGSIEISPELPEYQSF